MDYAVCRAFTFINYNMPIRGKEEQWEGFEKYYTTGFFDSMYTRRIACAYDKEQLKELWNYGIECATRGEGKYAHQNIFCFSMDGWNDIKDKYFWNPDNYDDALLTFVTFIQTKNYITDISGIQKQCRRFNEAASGQLDEKGRVYTYATVDKNDFVICIKCRNYKDAVNAIMKLHEAGCSVVYSYSVFGIAEAQQAVLTKEEYEKLNEQVIDSISLKGVTNSVRPNESAFYPLDRKYFSFCTRLVDELYKGVQKTEEADFKIYDILGDNDFRLIARMVPLGNLIRQFCRGGMMNYYGDATQFTFFSTHLILNTRDPEKESLMQPLEDDAIAKETDQMKALYTTEKCVRLKTKMDSVLYTLETKRESDQPTYEKLTAASHGIYQLLQSLTALEAAPTKKYDFFSIYYPLETLVNILKEACHGEKEAKELAENDRLYDFVHKISMTLHGTLRTDIQFFQIRDFNATVHYAPAKLRAYYTLLVFMLSTHIKGISQEVKKHSYIFCPGMFRDIAVSQLRCRPADTERLMLITVPERYLYFPKNLTIILAHEVGHLAGEKIRQREKRHSVFLECSYRIWCLQATKYTYSQLSERITFKYDKQKYKDVLKYDDKQLLNALLQINVLAEKEEKDPAHIYYSESSMKRILDVYGLTGDNYKDILWTKYSFRLQEVFHDKLKKDVRKTNVSYSILTENIRNHLFFCESLVKDLDGMFELYWRSALPELLQILHYLLSEPVSDILAILVLGMEPLEYLNSMADEFMTAKPEERFGQNIHKVRIALVIHVMEQLQKEYGDKETLKGQLQPWTDIYGGFMQGMRRDIAAFPLLLEAFDYQDSITDKSVAIDGYQDFFARRRKKVGERTYDFLNDEVIFNKMGGYLKSCGEEYVKQQLTENSEYEHTRQIVADSFRKDAYRIDRRNRCFSGKI